MRDLTKVTIGLGSIWGLFAFGAMLFGSFTIGANDSAPEIIAIVLYGLTFLPSCILAIWFQKHAAIWLIALCPIAAFGFIYQVLAQSGADKVYGAIARGVTLSLIIAFIPGFLGMLLLRTEQPKQML